MVPTTQPPAPQWGLGMPHNPLPVCSFSDGMVMLPPSFLGLVLALVPRNCLLPMLLCHRPCFWWPSPHAAGEDGFLMPEHSFTLLIDSLRSG